MVVTPHHSPVLLKFQSSQLAKILKEALKVLGLVPYSLPDMEGIKLPVFSQHIHVHMHAQWMPTIAGRKLNKNGRHNAKLCY
jgi:hypothetical protein